MTSTWPDRIRRHEIGGSNLSFGADFETHKGNGESKLINCNFLHFGEATQKIDKRARCARLSGLRISIRSPDSNLSPLGGTGYASSLDLRSQLSNTAALFLMMNAPAVLRYK